MKQNKRIIIIVYIISILIYIFISYLNTYYKNLLYSQTVASRWSDNGRYAQITCLLDPESQLTVTSIEEQYKNNIDQSLSQISEEYVEWLYCYSNSVKGTIAKDINSSEVEIIGVGGDFFDFHSLTLLSGSYIASDDLMKDRAVITETVAWKLFGSNNIAGQVVTIANKEFMIAGVVRLEDDKYSRTACNEIEKVFVPFDKMAELSSVSGVGNSGIGSTKNNIENSAIETPITCLEIVMANPISNFAYNTVKETFNLDENMIEIIQNSKRYDSSNLISIAKSFKSRSMILNQIRYPYWENAARAIENQLLIVLFWKNIISCFIAISIIIFIIRNLRRLNRSAKLNIREKLLQLGDIRNSGLIFRRRRAYLKDLKKLQKK